MCTSLECEMSSDLKSLETLQSSSDIIRKNTKTGGCKKKKTKNFKENIIETTWIYSRT